jgi:hypothetical protein
MVLSVIDVLLAFLDGLVVQLYAITAQQARLLRAEERARTLGNTRLAEVVACARGSLDAQLQGLSQSLGPINRLIAVVNLFMEMLGLDGLPTMNELGADAQRALESISQAVNALKEVRARIPL